MRGVQLIHIFAVSGLAFLSFQTGAEPTYNPALQQYLTQPGFNWLSHRTENFQLYFQPDSEAQRQIEVLKVNAEEGRSRVLQLIGERQYKPTVHAFLLKSGEEMRVLVGAPVNGRSRPAQHALFSVVTENRLDLTHEICHEVVSNLWGTAEHWIEEGLATFADEGINVYWDSWTLMERGELIELDKLVSPKWETSMHSPDVTYSQLGGFVKYLYDTYGADRLKQVWKGGSASIPNVYGRSLSELDREWRDSLVRQFPQRPTRHYRQIPIPPGGWVE